MQSLHGVLFDSGGNPMSSVTVTVRLAGTATLAGLYGGDRTAPKSNPFLNDPNGSYDFYAANGRYDITFAKAGVVFVTADSTDVLFFDPADGRDSYTSFLLEGYSAWNPGAGLEVVDGHYFTIAGSILILPSSQMGNAIEVKESGGTAGRMDLSLPSAMSFPWTLNARDLTFYTQLQKVQDAVAGTRRVGLTDTTFGSGDPPNGVYIRQVDGNQAFVVCRSGGLESSYSLGSGLASPHRVMVRMSNNRVQAWLDGVDVLTGTTNIPTVGLGLSIHGGSTGGGGGILVGCVAIFAQPQVT